MVFPEQASHCAERLFAALKMTWETLPGRSIADGPFPGWQGSVLAAPVHGKRGTRPPDKLGPSGQGRMQTKQGGN